ncbi:MAG: DUF86 domain-containing protein [Deltaproteobacteria bacterium]|nr:DUF86 domain-containing protein [Deltaproteobacteria bacterium]MBI4223805.1 DUF86 domain-containing protein [Deltaproteobacteria bacterium]
MVDQTLIERKFTLLRQKRMVIEGYSIPSLRAFRENQMAQKAVEKMLQEMIEICMDVGKHIIADENFRIPEDGKAIFTVLGEQSVLTKETAEMMQKMVGFRNIVVHLYETTDVETVYTIYTKHLSDFDLFSKKILGYLKRA